MATYIYEVHHTDGDALTKHPYSTKYNAVHASVSTSGVPTQTRCIHCGDVLPIGALWCVSCGAKVVQTGKTIKLEGTL